MMTESRTRTKAREIKHDMIIFIYNVIKFFLQACIKELSKLSWTKICHKINHQFRVSSCFVKTLRGFLIKSFCCNRLSYKVFAASLNDLLNCKSCPLVHAKKTFNFINAIWWSLQEKFKLMIVFAWKVSKKRFTTFWL